MNRKSQTTLIFLLALLLGLILYGGTAAVVSKYFRLSSKSTENFNQFVIQINNMENKATGEREIAYLIMDKETAIVVFNKDSDSTTGILNSNEVTFPKPPPCPDDQTCICLITKFSQSGSLITVEKAKCNSLELRVWVGASSTPIIARTKTFLSKTTLREQTVYLEKTASDQFTICKEPPCIPEIT